MDEPLSRARDRQSFMGLWENYKYTWIPTWQGHKLIQLNLYLFYCFSILVILQYV